MKGGGVFLDKPIYAWLNWWIDGSINFSTNFYNFVKVSVYCFNWGFFPIGIIYFQGPLALGVATFIFGLGYGAIWPLYAACARDYFPKKTAGSVMGLWTLILGIGSLSSPVAAGWTIDSTGAYTWAFMLAIAAGVLSAVLLLPIIKVPALASSEQWKEQPFIRPSGLLSIQHSYPDKSNPLSRNIIRQINHAPAGLLHRSIL